MEKKETFSYAFREKDLKRIFKLYFEQMGYENVKIKNVKHNIDFIPMMQRTGNKVTVALDLLDSVVSFESTGKEK